MNRCEDIRKSLVNVDDSVLIIVDIQDSFLDKYDNAVSQSIVAKAVWIIEVAKYLQVPVVAMAEDIKNAGNLNESILEALPEGVSVYNKDCFGLAGNPEILAAVNATGRKTAVLIGMETDVCVAQSALGLMGNGYQVVALRDAMGTTAADQDIGLSRIREAGAVISSVKALYFEWLRSVTNCKKLRAETLQLRSDIKPDSLVL